MTINVPIELVGLPIGWLIGRVIGSWLRRRRSRR
jgi:hypothetical protein